MPSHSFGHGHRRAPPPVEPRAGAVSLADGGARPHQPADGVRRARPAARRGGDRPDGGRAVGRERRGHRLHARGRGRRARHRRRRRAGCRSTGPPTRRGASGEIEGHPAFRGVRCSINFEPDVEWLLRPDVGEGLALLEARGIPFDVVSVRRRHLELVPILSERHPDLVMIIDHLSKPPIGRDESWVAGWQRNLRAAAANPNVLAKVSGLFPARGDLADWTADDVRPFLHDALEAFGAERLMWGSDWPIVDLAGGYAKVWTELNRLFDELDAGGARRPCAAARRHGSTASRRSPDAGRRGHRRLGAAIPWTGLALDSLAQYGYGGPIRLVNPRREELLGRPCLPSVAALPGTPTSASCSRTPPGRGAVRGAGRPRVPARRGRVERLRRDRTDEGRAARARPGEACAGATSRLIGPNCVGFASFHEGLCALTQPLPDGVVPGRGLGLQPERRAHRGRARGAVLQRRARHRPLLLDRQRRRLRARRPRCARRCPGHDAVVCGVAESVRDPAGVGPRPREAARAGKLLVFCARPLGGVARAWRRSHTGAVVGEQQLLAAWLAEHGVVAGGLAEQVGGSRGLFGSLGRAGPRERGTSSPRSRAAARALTATRRSATACGWPADPDTADRPAPSAAAAGGRRISATRSTSERPGRRPSTRPRRRPDRRLPGRALAAALAGRLRALHRGSAPRSSGIAARPGRPGPRRGRQPVRAGADDWAAGSRHSRGVSVTPDLELTDGGARPAATASRRATPRGCVRRGARSGGRLVAEAAAREVLAAAGLPVVRGAEAARRRRRPWSSPASCGHRSWSRSRAPTSAHKDRIGGVRARADVGRGGARRVRARSPRTRAPPALPLRRPTCGSWSPRWRSARSCWRARCATRSPARR